MEMVRRFKSFAGHRLRELAVHASRLRQPARLRRIVISPCASRSLGSSHLRAYELGLELRRHGWRVTILPPQLERLQRQRIVRLENPDVILLQKARHPLNRPSLFPGRMIIFDIDDADYLDDKQRDPVIECCRQSQLVIAGSSAVANWCSQYNSNAVVVWTGTPVLPRKHGTDPAERAPIVAWAHSDPLGYPRECELIRAVICALAQTAQFEFWLYGAGDGPSVEGFLGPIRQAGVRVRVIPFMKYRRFLASLEGVAVGLHPVSQDSPFSLGKSFGKVLGYLAAHVAIVASNALDHPKFFRHGENGLLASTTEEWVSGTRALLLDTLLRRRLANTAYIDFERELTIEAAANKVDGFLRAGLARLPMDGRGEGQARIVS
jgi:hypothetical protein